MNDQLTEHARKVLAERGIAVEWMERTLDVPEWIISRCISHSDTIGGITLKTTHSSLGGRTT